MAKARLSEFSYSVSAKSVRGLGTENVSIKRARELAGTEFGAYFSPDEGKRWIELDGLPTIAVRDIDIQRRENDLVLGTFGRGFWVLDDYSPLRRADRATRVTRTPNGAMCRSTAARSARRRYDRRLAWADWDCKSCAHWISHQCGIAPGAALWTQPGFRTSSTE